MNGRPISGASVGARTRRRKGALAVLPVLMLLAVTACGGGGGSDTGSDGDKGKGSDRTASDKAATKASEAVVSIAPKNGADDVATNGALEVSAAKGKLSEVTVENDKGEKIAGEISGDGATWTPSIHLNSATEYKVHAVAKDSEGREAAEDSSFTTLTPKNTFVGIFTPEDGSKVGVGMPFSIRFTRGITAPEDVEKAITIKTEPAVDVEGHWFGNDRLDFRPEKYWKAGTKVTVDLNLDGVEGRDGVYGEQSKKVSFTIGRSQVSVVDVKKLTMKVSRDGKVVKTIPVTTGQPGMETWNGQMVISERLRVTRMNGETVGYGGEYDIKDVPDAMRLTNSGTFIHGNYWGGGAFGNYNASHGCIGLRDTRGGYDRGAPGAWFFDHSMVGDVVVVKNSNDRTVDPDNGYNGWNMDWDKWKA
ncbi:L,D-transpeptidase [Streptomyces europaeiscabiei]|uniref:Ig-like domain-containing protein n=1 Tax=Streptomyces europaeiscabiei TaxID=146819 RepID=A0ABU4NU83_9ACTN|nr:MULTISPECIES: Ig-like domain-containing protein [Streptomyces]MDX2531135.1 Ig-like domain-containing protein [Streptomyces europaeiscabiei]MDX2759244.1 Ig-like domain-containing protein [Streptomyces europaeiscabiei]MDX2769575.1 Ig-like domain-containing protein [Streptomyces europaeiscabiei]MDX3549929.1 Ig-like domain-containing protein [Streptomyces europaeiscabiei]MDX3557388.1 Ig-like domain-containing protein [Streptomyces europaeiscabiei]